MAISHVNNIAAANISAFGGVAKANISAINGVTASFGGGGGGSITHVATQTATSAVNTTLSIVIPAGTQTDDVLILSCFNRLATADPSTPTDDDTGGNTWAKILSGNNGTSNISVWWKRATSGTASKTITMTGFTGCAGGVSVYRGVDTGATPYENATYESNASGNEDHAAISPSVNGSLVCVALGSIALRTYSTFSATDPAAITQRFSQQLNSCTCAHASAVQTTAGSTGTVAFDVSANTATLSIVFDLIPD